MAYANTFKRREMKFLLNEEQYRLMFDEISRYMTEDKFGMHTIMNIYLDNKNNDLICSSIAKPVYREKLRLRAYGKTAEDDSKAFLEIKKKFKGVTYKRRLEGGYKELFDYIAEGKTPDLPNTEKYPNRRQVLEEIDYLIGRMELEPRIVICYDREAFFGNEDREFRVTFDGNIRYRRDDLDLRSGDGGERLDSAPFRVMEVKSAGAFPLWLVKILSDNKIYQGSFSKYVTIYQHETANGLCGSVEAKSELCGSGQAAFSTRAC